MQRPRERTKLAAHRGGCLQTRGLACATRNRKDCKTMRGNTALPMASMAGRCKLGGHSKGQRRPNGLSLTLSACGTLKRQRDPVDTELSIHTISLASMFQQPCVGGRMYPRNPRETEALPSETRSNAKQDHIHMTTLADASPSIPQRPIACRLAVAASLLIRTKACLPLAMGLCLARYTSVQDLALPLLRGCCCFASAKTTTHHLPVQEKSKTWHSQVFDLLDSIDVFFFSDQMTLFRRLHCL